jgi:NAD(P)-dependent dehydrogenase (short-subunit alcohol dehydrogenase family)
VKEFKGRVAVVTGAASGIGRGLAERFGAEGMKVVLGDIEEQALRQAEAEMREKGVDVIGVVTDVSRPEQVENLAQQTLNAFGGVHIVCNNAGVVGGSGGFGRTWESTLKDWQWILGVNLWGVINGVRTFLPIMLEKGDEGHIVNTSSFAGMMGGGGIYGVTKQAVVALSESLFSELKVAGAKVGVSVLCPAWVKTSLADAARNRPKELTNTAEAPPNAQSAAAEQMIRNFLDGGLPPSEIADQVMTAIREEKLYILTHPEMDDIIRTRFDNILARRNPEPSLLA